MLSLLQAALLSGSGQSGSAHSAAMEQMRSLAEASLQELQARIGERDEQIARLQGRLAEQQAAALAQQQKARQELAALSHKLLDQEAGALQGLKAALSQAQVRVQPARPVGAASAADRIEEPISIVPAAAAADPCLPCFLSTLAQAAARSAAAGASASELPYEQLRAQLAEKAAEVEALACRLEAKQAELEVAQEAARAQGQRWGHCCSTCRWEPLPCTAECGDAVLRLQHRRTKYAPHPRATHARRQAVQVAALQEQVKVQQVALEQAAQMQQASAKDQAAALQQMDYSLQQHAAALHHAAQQQLQASPLRRHASYVQPPEVPEPHVPAAPRPDSPMRSAVQKLQSQLRHKDEKLRQLKDAIRCAWADAHLRARRKCAPAPVDHPGYR